VKAEEAMKRTCNKTRGTRAWGLWGADYLNLAGFK